MEPVSAGQHDYGMRQQIGLALGLLLFVVLLLVPTPDGMPPVAQRTAAVAALMAVWWITEAAPIPVTALLPLALYPALDIMPSRQVGPHYGNHIIFLFVGGFIIAVAMEKWNLHRRVALGTISLFGTRPSRLVLGFMCATAFLSMWISNTATTMMMLPIAAAVVNQMAELAQMGRRIAGRDAGAGALDVRVDLASRDRLFGQRRRHRDVDRLADHRCFHRLRARTLPQRATHRLRRLEHALHPDRRDFPADHVALPLPLWGGSAAQPHSVQRRAGRHRGGAAKARADARS